MTYGSLFTGIGGLDLGLDRAGMECRWQVEIEPYAVRVLEKHWPHVKRYGDITKITGDELEPVDLICGGFPCQDLSQAGKRAGIEGTRSGLWFEYARLVGELRPRYVLVENVPGLLVYDGMRRVIGELSRLGYVGIWRSLRASEFGASHLRKRVFIVAWREGRSEPGRANGWNGREITRCTGEDLAYSECDRRRQQPVTGQTDKAADRFADGSSDVAYSNQAEPLGFSGLFGALADAQRTGLEERDGQRELQFHRDSIALTSGLPAFAPGPSDPRWPAILRDRPDLAPALESPVCRMADWISSDLDGAMSNRTKRLGRLGNAVVPQVAEWIGCRIQEFEEERYGN